MMMNVDLFITVSSKIIRTVKMGNWDPLYVM